MKTYDVTIKLQVVSLKNIPLKEAAKQLQEAAHGLVHVIAGNDVGSACELRIVEVIDHDSLPQLGHICASCSKQL